MADPAVYRAGLADAIHGAPLIVALARADQLADRAAKLYVPGLVGRDAAERERQAMRQEAYDDYWRGASAGADLKRAGATIPAKVALAVDRTLTELDTRLRQAARSPAVRELARLAGEWQRRAELAGVDWRDLHGFPGDDS